MRTSMHDERDHLALDTTTVGAWNSLEAVSSTSDCIMQPLSSPYTR